MYVFFTFRLHYEVYFLGRKPSEEQWMILLSKAIYDWSEIVGGT